MTCGLGHMMYTNKLSQYIHKPIPFNVGTFFYLGRGLIQIRKTQNE